MRFYDIIMQSKTVPSEQKSKLDGATVIVADNVASYYYEGTDKEHWDLSDFPNVAPPFPRFWLECKAPAQCVSSERGTRPWDNRMPSYWGFYVTASLVESIPERLSTNAGRQALKEDLLKQFNSLDKSTNAQVPNYLGMIQRFEQERIKELVNEKQYTMIAEVMSIVEALTHIDNKEYDKAASVLIPMYSYKWYVHIDLWQRMSFHSPDEILPACWAWQMYVKSDGSVLANQHTGIPMIMSAIGNTYADILEALIAAGLDYNDAMKMSDDSVNPFLHTLLLSMSFLHCRNVNLDTVTPPKHVVHNKNAKRRGETDFQPVQFKTLDIKPMRQVLKTEGQEDTQGTAKALHICRGHFKHYEEGRGLFGKYHGTYWFPQHTRGTLDRGTVVKDYRIQTP
jgi:hypothetical protein